MSDGPYRKARERFSEIVAEHGLDTVAKKLGFSVSMCSYVRLGTKRPSLAMAAAIQEHFAIPAIDWAPKKRGAA